jgi:hypothetical protein
MFSDEKLAKLNEYRKRWRESGFKDGNVSKLLDPLVDELEKEPKIVICDTCGEKLEYKENWGKEHIEKFPEHRGPYVVKFKEERLNY